MSYAQRVQPCCGDPLEPHGGFSIPFLGDGSCDHIWGLELHVLGWPERARVSDPGCGQARPAGPRAVGAVTSTSVVPSCREDTEKAPCSVQVLVRTWQNKGPPSPWVHAGGAPHPQSQLTSAFFLCGCGFGCHWGEEGGSSAVAPHGQTTWGLEGSLRKFSPHPVLGTPDVGPWIITGHLMQCNWPGIWNPGHPGNRGRKLACQLLLTFKTWMFHQNRIAPLSRSEVHCGKRQDLVFV